MALVGRALTRYGPQPLPLIPSPPLVERGDAVDDVGLLLGRQLGIDRQRQGLPGGALGFGEVSGLVSQVAEALLAVERHGALDLRADALGGQERSQRGPRRRADHGLVADVAAEPG